MATAFAPAQLHSLVVEDDRRDKLEIEDKLRSARVFNYEFYENYKPEPFMAAAKAADIVSLDLEVEHVKYQSINVCRRLKELNPDQSVVFFTSSPEEVLQQPINFVLDKSRQVWESYERLLMMILIHDRTLALLRNVIDMSAEHDTDSLRREYDDLRERLTPFISSLMSIREFFKKDDKVAARRYRNLTKMLEKIHAVGTNTDQIFPTLHNMQQPLMSIVLTELDEIKQIKGVYATPKLENEIDYLRTSVLPEDDTDLQTADLKQRAKVYAMEKLAASLRALTRFLPRHALAPDAKAPIDETTVIEETVQKSVREQPLYLNVWFPEYGETDLLLVDVTARLLINLAHTLVGARLSSSEGISEDRSTLLSATPSVDVMVICPHADVEPLLATLQMPSESPVEFKVTPKDEGAIDLTVVLLIRNEPIYRSVFSFYAELMTFAAGETTTGNAVTRKEVQVFNHDVDIQR